MKRKWKQALTLSVLLALGGGSQAWAADFSVTQLEVNHMQAPMGLDESKRLTIRRIPPDQIS